MVPTVDVDDSLSLLTVSELAAATVEKSPVDAATATAATKAAIAARAARCK